MLVGKILAVAAALLGCGAAVAQEQDFGTRERPEAAVAVLAHGIRHPFRGAPPAGYDIYESEEERGTTDVQLVYRSAPLSGALKPRLNARVQVNSAGRTNFASVGAEWRQHVLRGRVYGQIGIGLAVHDGYLHPTDPFAPNLSGDEAARRYDLYTHRTAFGSPVLFNPNLSIGLRITKRWAVEAAFEHFSHRSLFANQNPGIDMLGVRLVRVLGR